jgi:hypothetical protein
MVVGGSILAGSASSCAHDDDRLRLPPASPARNSKTGKKESTGPRLSQLCPPCATPFSKFSLDYRRNDARIVENGFAASSGVSKSAKVVLGRVLINLDCWAIAAAANDVCGLRRRMFRRFSAAVATSREGHRSPRSGREAVVGSFF